MTAKPVTKAQKERQDALKTKIQKWQQERDAAASVEKALVNKRQSQGWRWQDLNPVVGCLLWQEHHNGNWQIQVLTQCVAIDGNVAHFKLVDERSAIAHPIPPSGLWVSMPKYWQGFLPMEKMRVLAHSDYPKTLSVSEMPAEAFGNADEIAEWKKLAQKWENDYTFKSYFELIPQVKILSLKKGFAFKENEGDVVDAEIFNCSRLSVGDTKENGWGVFLGVEPKSIERKSRIRPDWDLPKCPDEVKPWGNGRKLDFAKECLVAVCPEAIALCTSDWLMGSANYLAWSANGLEYTATIKDGQVIVTVDELPDRVPSSNGGGSCATSRDSDGFWNK